MSELGNCILYARFSTKGQRHGMSIERQLGEGRSYAHNKGWRISEELIDEGRSAFHGHHRLTGALGAFEAEARQGCHRGTILVVERLDRLERGGPEDTFAFITGLTSSGVSIATIDGDEFYAAGAKLDMAQMMLLLLKAQVAHEESLKKSERSRSNWRIKHERAAATGEPLSKRCPAWLTVEDGHYKIRRDRARIIARIFKMADAGQGSTSITKSLNVRRISPLGTAAMWHRTRVSQLLYNRQVVGEHQTAAGTIMLYPAIVAREVFERVCAQALLRKIARGGPRSPKVNNLLSGLCCCRQCGGSMSYLGGGYLTCLNAQQRAGCSNSVRVRYGPVEGAVLDSFLHLALDNNTFTNRAEVARLSAAIEEHERERRQALIDTSRLIDHYARSNPEMTGALASAAQRREQALTKRINAMLEEIERANGRASTDEHIRRVSDARQRLKHDITLRKRVAQGLRRHIKQLSFGRDGTVTASTRAAETFHIVRGAIVANPRGVSLSSFAN